MTQRKENPITTIQWNARGLSKAKLEEFQFFLSYSSPTIVLLSETHWSDTKNVLFSSLNVIKKNWNSQKGGGVAILVHKSIKYNVISLKHFLSFEAIAISINTSNQSIVDVISVYAPKGDTILQPEILSLFSRSNPYIIGGDFNAHHSYWELKCESWWQLSMERAQWSEQCHACYTMWFGYSNWSV